MGKRKYRLVSFNFIVFIIVLFFTSCFISHKSIKIESFSIEKEKILINLESKNFNQIIGEASLENDEYYYVFDKIDINSKMKDNKLQVELNCKDRKIKTNQEYRLSLHFSGGGAYADIFFGNPITTIDDSYPCENYENIRIIVFDTSTAIGI